MNIRSYRKMIREMKTGETFYFNAIGGSVKMIEYTKELIRSGIIAPVQNEIDKVIKHDAQADFFTGDKIAPQMVYVIK